MDWPEVTAATIARRRLDVAARLDNAEQLSALKKLNYDSMAGHECTGTVVAIALEFIYHSERPRSSLTDQLSRLPPRFSIGGTLASYAYIIHRPVGFR